MANKKKEENKILTKEEELIKSGIFYEYEEDGVSFSDLKIDSNYTLFDYLNEHGVLLKEKNNGYYNAYDAYYDNSASEEIVHLYEIPNNRYIVSGVPEISDGAGDVLSFSILITNSYDTALSYYESIPHMDYSINEQISLAHNDLDKEISGLWFDAKHGSYPGTYSWNIKKDYCLLIEKTKELNPEEIKEAVKKHQEFKSKCSAAGIRFVNYYKKPREWNNNQRYYVFEFFAGGKERQFEAHIPSKMQNKKRFPLDFFKPEWFDEMADAEKKFMEAGGAQCEICNQHMLKANGCNMTKIKIHGKIFKRIPVSTNDVDLSGKCGDCGATVGYYHHFLCDMEICPKCGLQMLSCDCPTFDQNQYIKE